MTDGLERDNAVLCEASVDMGLDVNTRYNDTSFKKGDLNSTLLHWAARYGSPACARVSNLHNLSISHSLQFRFSLFLELMW